MIIKGGKTIYGNFIGILMLQTRFPRIPGDIGNASTFDFPILYRIIKPATIDNIVEKTDLSLLQEFIKGAQELEREGALSITTSCGFLSIFQRELANSVMVPVFTSSLLLVPLVSRMIGGRKVGIITANSENLTRKHLEGAGIDPSISIAIKGLEDKEEFSRMILNDSPVGNIAKIREEVKEAARELINENPDVGAIVLECANLPPYAKIIQDITNLPVFDITTLANMVYSALVRKEFK